MKFTGSCVIGALVGVLVLSGCSADSFDDKVTEGLDQNVAREVLDNPVSREKVMSWEKDQRDSAYQSVVRNFMLCRDVHQFYENWTKTGQAGPIPELPQPTNPVEPGASEMNDYYAYLKKTIADDGIDGVRRFLTGVSSCGEWIPAQPGKYDGPTIENVVTGTK